ncbi:MAG: M23 family metallopeptidase [Clostridia bacterium]|nr:M23 family metallopeptidase [Clostridia bacterium]
MHEKDGAKAKWTKFSEDKGFIAILMLCIAAIGISGYVLFFLPAEQAAEEYEIGLGESLPSANAAVPDSMPKVPDVTMQLEPEPAPEPVPVQKETAVDGPTEVILPAEEEELAETWIFKKPPTYRYPVSGEVIRTYSADALQYDETMGDWRTHNGVDIACAMGDPVLAIADGTVEEIYEDVLEGTIIVLRHEEGLVSKYCGLAPEARVLVGDAVKAGDAIGTAGNTMKTESLMECHIHLVVKADGKYIDPLSLKFE